MNKESPHCSITLPNNFLIGEAIPNKQLQEASKFTVIDGEGGDSIYDEFYTKLYYVQPGTPSSENLGLISGHRIAPLKYKEGTCKWSQPRAFKSVKFEKGQEKVDFAFFFDFYYGQSTMKNRNFLLIDRLRLSNVSLLAKNAEVRVFTCVRDVSLQDDGIEELTFEVNVSIELKRTKEVINSPMYFICAGDGSFSD